MSPKDVHGSNDGNTSLCAGTEPIATSELNDSILSDDFNHGLDQVLVGLKQMRISNVLTPKTGQKEMLWDEQREILKAEIAEYERKLNEYENQNEDENENENESENENAPLMDVSGDREKKDRNDAYGCIIRISSIDFLWFWKQIRWGLLLNIFPMLWRFEKLFKSEPFLLWPE